MKKFLVLATVPMFILFLGCQNPTGDYSIEDNYQEEDIINEVYEEDYLYSHSYISLKGFNLDDYFDNNRFSGTWESINEAFLFENDTFKYWKNKNTVEPELTGEFRGMNNGEDLSCVANDDNGWRIKIFTPFNFIDDNNLYLGFPNNGVQFVKVDGDVNDVVINNNNELENNIDKETEQNNNDNNSVVDYNYLNLDKNLNIGNVLNFYTEIKFKSEEFEGLWESEDNEQIQFDFNYFKYWNDKHENIMPTIEGYIGYNYFNNITYLCVRDGFSEVIFVFTSYEFIDRNLYLDIYGVNKKFVRG